MAAIRQDDRVHGARSQQEELQDWLARPGVKRALQACTDAVVQRITDDLELRVPRTEQDRADGFSLWLGRSKAKLRPAIQQEFRHQFTGIHDRLREDYVRDLVSEMAWPQIEHFLLSYAVLGLSRSWISRNLGDAVIQCEPEWADGEWIVRLQIPDWPHDIGKVVLDPDGNIVLGRTSSRDEVLKALHA